MMEPVNSYLWYDILILKVVRKQEFWCINLQKYLPAKTYLLYFKTYQFRVNSYFSRLIITKGSAYKSPNKQLSLRSINNIFWILD